MDNVREQRKFKARKMLEDGAESLPFSERFVGQRFWKNAWPKESLVPLKTHNYIKTRMRNSAYHEFFGTCFHMNGCAVNITYLFG